MNRTTVAVLALAVVAASVAAAIGAAAVGTNGAAGVTNATVLPGSQYAGTVGAGEAEVEAAYRDRAFGVRLAAAETNESRAAVVADEVEAIRTSLARLETLAESLQDDSEEVEDGERTARVARLVAQRVALEQRVERTEDAAARLPTALRERHDVTDAAFRDLRVRLDGLTTPEMDEEAYELVGEDAGESLDELDEEYGDDESDENDTDADDGDAEGDGDSDDSSATESGDDSTTADAGDGSTDGDSGDGDGGSESGDADGSG